MGLATQGGGKPLRRRLAIGYWLSALLLGCWVLVGCAESTAQLEVPDRVTFSTAAPDSLSAGAKAALTRLPVDTTKQRYGVVLGVTTKGDWYARILARDGVVVLTSHGCRDWEPAAYWRQTASPGDAVRWTTKGGDNTVCPGEFHVVDLGAAYADAAQ